LSFPSIKTVKVFFLPGKIHRIRVVFFLVLFLFNFSNAFSQSYGSHSGFSSDQSAKFLSFLDSGRLYFQDSSKDSTPKEIFHSSFQDTRLIETIANNAGCVFLFGQSRDEEHPFYPLSWKLRQHIHEFKYLELFSLPFLAFHDGVNDRTWIKKYYSKGDVDFSRVINDENCSVSIFGEQHLRPMIFENGDFSARKNLVLLQIASDGRIKKHLSWQVKGQVLVNSICKHKNNDYSFVWTRYDLDRSYVAHVKASGKIEWVYELKNVINYKSFVFPLQNGSTIYCFQTHYIGETSAVKLVLVELNENGARFITAIQIPKGQIMGKVALEFPMAEIVVAKEQTGKIALLTLIRVGETRMTTFENGIENTISQTPSQSVQGIVLDLDGKIIYYRNQEIPVEPAVCGISIELTPSLKGTYAFSPHVATASFTSTFSFENSSELSEKVSTESLNLSIFRCDGELTEVSNIEIFSSPAKSLSFIR